MKLILFKKISENKAIQKIKPFSFINIVLFIIIVFSILKGVIWFPLLLFSGIVLNLLLNILNLYRKKNIFLGIIYYALIFLTILFIAIVIRLFILEIYMVPSYSMAKTILPGDRILVTKLAYGPALPTSPFEIPWINLYFYLNKKTRLKSDSIWWRYRRLKGFSSVKVNDIVVFYMPGRKDPILIKRCISLPGDTIIIKNGKVYLNNKQIPIPEKVMFTYRIYFKNYQQLMQKVNELKINFFNTLSYNENYISVIMSVGEKELLKEQSLVDSITIEKSRPDTSFQKFPNDTLYRWTLDDFGPLILPSKGTTLKLSKNNYALYKDIINNYENNKIKLVNDTVYLNDIVAKTYTFQKNYYFVMGDHRHDSRDSRYIGLIPEESIIGKAFLIMYSKDEYKWYFNRFFKKLK